MRWLDRRPDVQAVAIPSYGHWLDKFGQGRHRRVPRAGRCCPIEGCGRLMEDEGHLMMECPFNFYPRTTLGLSGF
jgi:hypothetical protein